MTISIRARFALWFSAVMAVALTAFGAGALWLHTQWAGAQFDSELSSLGATVARVMQEELGESGNLRRAVAETRTTMDGADHATAILDDEGNPMAAHWHGLDSAGVIRGHGHVQRPEIMTIVQRGSQWRVLVRPERSSAGNYSVVIAGSLDRIATQHALLLRVLLLAGSIIIVMTAVISWWVASSALRPVTIMAGEAAALSVKAADWRLTAPTDTDELGRLARAFNDLLARLGTASHIQRQFMADASHELRTPVSVIQTATEVTLNHHVRDEAEYRDALTIIGEQSARLSRMVEDMFMLARADADQYRVSMRRMYIDEVVAEAVRAAAVVAAAKGLDVTSEIQPDIAIDGDDGLLHRMMTNLLDNAVQHTPTGGSIRVILTSEGRDVAIAVADTGPGIPAADRDRVFDRFVRLDQARSDTSGGGLGLSIARWIAEQHYGTLTLDVPPRGGCVFVVHLPLTPDRPQPRAPMVERLGSTANMNIT